MQEFSSTVTELKLRTIQLDFYLEELGAFKFAVAHLLVNDPSIRLIDVRRKFPTLIFPNESTVRHWKKKYLNGERFISVKSSRHRDRTKLVSMSSTLK